MNDVWTTVSKDPVIIGEVIVLIVLLIVGFFWMSRTEIRADESDEE